MSKYSTDKVTFDVTASASALIACADGDGIIAATTETVRDKWQKLVGAFKGMDKASKRAAFGRLRAAVYEALDKKDKKRYQRIRERLSRLKGAIGLKRPKPSAAAAKPMQTTTDAETPVLGRSETITLAKPASGIIQAAGPARLNWMANTLRKVMEETGLDEKTFKSIVKNALSVM